MQYASQLQYKYIFQMVNVEMDYLRGRFSLKCKVNRSFTVIYCYLLEFTLTEVCS